MMKQYRHWKCYADKRVVVMDFRQRIASKARVSRTFYNVKFATGSIIIAAVHKE